MLTNQKTRSRYIVLFIISAIVAIILTVALYRLSIVEASDKNSLYVNSGISYDLTVSSSRGEIKDRNGRILVGNKPVYNLVFNKHEWDTDSQNETILRLIEIISAYGTTYNDSLPVSLFPYSYLTNQTKTQKSDFSSFLKDRKWEENITAVDLMEKLFLRYKLNQSSYTDAQKRLIAGVRYEMEIKGFTWSGSFCFAEDVSQDLIALIKENTFAFPGVSASIGSERTYNTSYAAHMLGRVGSIFAEEYEEFKKLGYAMNEKVGKDGAELAFESYLRGTSGKLRISKDSSGNTISEEYITQPSPGGNVYLTMDLELQKVAEEALANRIEKIKKLSESNKKYPEDIAGGAAVVLNVNTGEVLAMASYPTYSLKTFYSDYNNLLENPLTPMLNRCISAAYPPASTFKMVTAIAGLEENVINTRTLVNCSGVYTFYKDYRPRCWILKSKGTVHGDLNVTEAISNSCNCFFFETGRLLGIDTLDSYAERLGFGQKTGIELAGEVAGYRSNTKTKSALVDEIWYPGDTLQTAIGQSYTMVTPIQLACYISALANGGTLYSPTILSKVTSYDDTEMIYQNNAKINNKINIKKETLDAVIDGMLHVTEDGTASSVFKDVVFSVAGKTGSAQVSSGSDNAVFAAFAPVENPEIAVVVIVEHGNSGNSIAPIARTIFEAYFEQNHSTGNTVTNSKILY